MSMTEKKALEALRKLEKAGENMRNTVVESRGLRYMDAHDVALREARELLAVIDRGRDEGPDTHGCDHETTCGFCRARAALATQPAPSAPGDWLDLVIRDVCELDPADGPSSVSVEVEDLRRIIERHASAPSAPVADDAMVERALLAYLRADHEWTIKSADEHHEPRHRSSMRAALGAALSAPSEQVAASVAVPDGFVLVPAKFYIQPEAWEAAAFAYGGPATGEGEPYLACTAWVGDIEDDDGAKHHGLHISCDECPEEGSITLSEFAAAPVVPGAGHAPETPR